MIVLNILGYFGRNKQNSYAASTSLLLQFRSKGRPKKCFQLSRASSSTDQLLQTDFELFHPTIR